MAASTPATGENPLVAKSTPSTISGPTTLPSTTGGGGGRGRGKDGKEKETFACTFPGCGQTYSRMEYLKRHQRKHQDERPFQCKDCSKAFARSDVLLRHRRRCHPTPPPVDHSTSPPALNRIYNGMPVSSSRTDAREASPSHHRSRKHPRQSDGDEEHDQSRARIDPALRDDYDESSGERYRDRGYDNNGTYGQYYNASANDDHPNYSSHLMPMFNQDQSYHSLNDPDHLEDASVLLSMAYPGGVPGNGRQSQEQRDLPEWASNPTINLIMETAVANREREDADKSISDGNGTSSNPSPIGVQPQADAASVDASVPSVPEQAEVSAPVSSAPEVVSSGQQEIDPQLQSDAALVSTSATAEGFLNTMSWLSGMDNQGVFNKTGNTPDNSNWSLLRPPQNTPFPISSLFSPSAYGISSDFANGSTSNNDNNRPDSPNVLHILEQLAMYEVPQTAANPNPERPLLRVHHAEIATLAGEGIDKGSRFYIPADWFNGCYQIPHWALPPLRTLSMMACRTFHTLLNHFSFVHLPTFRLIDTAACLAFAICTVGGIRTGNSSILDQYLWQPPTGNGRPNPERSKALDGPVVPDQSWESLYEENWYRHNEPVRARQVSDVANWKNGPVVRSEKTNMLVKSFSLAKGVLMTEYNVALLQALILYHAPNFLSEDERERASANMFLGTIVNVTRQIGFFGPENDHCAQTIRIPEEPYTPNELDRCWREWIRLETRRRTAYLVYQLDTISSLESNIPCILSSSELAYIPLPAPDTLWKAPTAEAWRKAVKKYRPMTMDEAMRRTFFLPTYGTFDKLHQKADTQFYHLLNQSDYGPFARMAMVITLLRGVIDIGEGKRDRGDWRDLTDLWVGCSWLKPGKVILAQDGTDLGAITRDGLKDRFKQALQKWREGWDFDSLCACPTSGVFNCSNGMTSPENSGSGRSPNSDEDEIPKETLNYCEDALPIYWLAQALLNILYANSSHSSGTNVFRGLRYGDMLKSARTFTRTGEGVPIKVRNMSASQARDGSHRNSHSENSLSAQSISGRTQDNPPTPALTSSNPPSVRSTSFSPAEAKLSGLSADINDGTFAGILQALAANSEELGMNIGLNADDYPTQSGSDSGPGLGAVGANSTAITASQANAGASSTVGSSVGNGDVELTQNDLAKHLGLMI
ncbi:C2H2 zinc finger protein Zas1A [Cryptococcus gattii E566]|uniref:C2H2-type domain-containing protein n=2 Tax=Cryptococcus gattii TaxID=37769 RepID=E6RD68_CRYGW|nr:Hypothetical protein CGB_K0540W [Cryptococcus gattii WM276]ADV24752.1 Hypothetical protein CGB_K0540W [Cryptococcus gattii WM276]KIR79242.1 C2H2 zinc finger protein Zas1A [Cryptococcus gattii EJB2]KIY35175.1 C2H2 zinc finger protein Zas1A [Cryptococcus gattii E566]